MENNKLAAKQSLTASLKAEGAAKQSPTASLKAEGAAKAAPLYGAAKDFASGLPVKWCPGCGDFGILAMIQRVMANMNLPHEKYAVISGIGCSSRFPYYVNTYGFHSIHGRAPAIATGVKLSHPELLVWVITGDGDGLSIGGNHMIHSIRRNLGLKIVLFNNRIYALTKGQASPTTLPGSKTKTTPMGSIDYPFNPANFAVALGCTYVARGIDNDLNFSTPLLEGGARHEGTSFVEMVQKCVVFTDKEFDNLKNPETKNELTVRIEHGKPMIFGKSGNKAIMIRNSKPEVVEFGPKNPPADLTVYDSASADMAYIVSNLMPPDFPVPFGVFINAKKRSYEDLYYSQIKGLNEFKGISDMLKDSETYQIK